MSPATARDAVGVPGRSIPEQVREHSVDALARVLGAAGADDREHGPLGPLQIPREQLHPDEPGRAGEEHGTVGPRHSPSSGENDRSAHARRERVWSGEISSSMCPSAAATRGHRFVSA